MQYWPSQHWSSSWRRDACVWSVVSCVVLVPLMTTTTTTRKENERRKSHFLTDHTDLGIPVTPQSLLISSFHWIIIMGFFNFSILMFGILLTINYDWYSVEMAMKYQQIKKRNKIWLISHIMVCIVCWVSVSKYVYEIVPGLFWNYRGQWIQNSYKE